MPKITKLCLHLLKLCRENCGLFFSEHGVVLIIIYLYLCGAVSHDFVASRSKPVLLVA